jgi:hypothetical protein
MSYGELELYNEIKAVFPTLSQEESEAAFALVEERITTQGTTLERYMKYRYPEGLTRRLEPLADNHPDKYLQYVPEDAKKLIETGKTGDFPAFIFHAASIFRRQLKSKLLERAEHVYGVTNGEWTTEREARFAGGFYDYVKTQKDTVNNIYTQAANFIQRIYTKLQYSIDVSPDITEVYEDIFKTNQLNKGTVNYSFSQEGYEKRLRSIAGGHTEGAWIDLGITPPIYEKLGFQREILMITRAHLEHIMREKTMLHPQYHGIPFDLLKQIPEKLKTPLIILQSKNPRENIISIIELSDKDGSPIIVPIAYGRQGKLNKLTIDINHATTIYGIEGNYKKYISNAINQNRLLYVNIKKSRTLPRSDPSSVRQSGASASVTEFILDPVKTETSRSLSISGFYIKNIARYKELVKGFHEKKQDFSFHENTQPNKEEGMTHEHSQQGEYTQEARAEDALQSIREADKETGRSGNPEERREADGQRSAPEERSVEEESARKSGSEKDAAAAPAEPRPSPNAPDAEEEGVWKGGAEKGIDLMREYLSTDVHTQAGCFAAVREHWYMLKYVEPRFKTGGLCLEAVSQNGNALEFVDKGGMEKDELFAVCKEAVRRNPGAIRHVKDEFGLEKDEMFLLCVEAVKRDVSTLRYMKAEWKTSALYETAVKENGVALEFVPQEERDAGLCALAVKKNPFALKAVPERSQTQDMCRQAVNGTGAALRFVREDLKTPELCAEAVKRRGTALEYVPESIQTQDMCLQAVKQNPYNIRYAARQTPEICLLAVKRKGDALRYVKEKTPDVALEAVKQDREALYHLFPKDTPRIDLTADAFESNVKTLLAEHPFAAGDAARIIYAGMDTNERRRLTPLFGNKLDAENLPSLEKLFEKWEAEIRPETAQAESAGIRKIAAVLKEKKADMFLDSLGTQEFYKYADNAVKEAYYFEHLKESLVKGYEQPVFSIGDAPGIKGGLVAKPFGKDGREPLDNPLNPFSPAVVERMKEAAKAGVVFTDEKQKERQLAFMKENLPEVYKVVAETLKRREKSEALVIGDTRKKEEQTRGKKPTGYEYGR